MSTFVSQNKTLFALPMQGLLQAIQMILFKYLLRMSRFKSYTWLMAILQTQYLLPVCSCNDPNRQTLEKRDSNVTQSVSKIDRGFMILSRSCLGQECKLLAPLDSIHGTSTAPHEYFVASTSTQAIYCCIRDLNLHLTAVWVRGLSSTPQGNSGEASDEDIENIYESCRGLYKIIIIICRLRLLFSK